MSKDTWPEIGSGVSTFDPRVDGTPSKGPGVRKEPGRAKRSGSRRNDMYLFWLDTLESATRGRAIMIFVDKPRFYSNLKTIRNQLTGGEDVNMKPINDRIRAGIVAYAEAIEARQIAMDGKPAWPIFMRTWTKYVHEAAPTKATDDEIISGERHWDD